VAAYISRLAPEHQVDSFDCGDADLNTYLRRYARKNQEKYSVGVTYVCTDPAVSMAALGYYTLATSSIPKTDLPQLSRAIPYPQVPAVLLARLAADRSFQAKGIGSLLLKDALQRALRLKDSSGCRLVLVDAYESAVEWYLNYGFIMIDGRADGSRTRRMFLDALTIERAINPY
jgi:GNAT superfamily N-acetyltransferase